MRRQPRRPGRPDRRSGSEGTPAETRGSGSRRVKSLSFLLLRQLPKSSRQKRIKVRTVGAEKTVRGQATTRASPEVCRTSEQMQPCLHPGLGPAVLDARRAPVVTLWGHRQRSHSTDNTRTTPARCTPTHSTTLRGGCQPGADRKSRPGSRPSSSQARYPNVAVCVQTVPAPP